MQTISRTATALAILMASATASAAMGACDARGAIAEHLEEAFGETHLATGLDSPTGLIEIWSSDETGTWTILLTRPDGRACVVASGTHFLIEDKARLEGVKAAWRSGITR